MSEYATIVHENYRGWLRRSFYADVVLGTIQSYYPSSAHRFRGWTAAGAKRRGDRYIRRVERAEASRARRRAAARKATGYA